MLEISQATYLGLICGAAVISGLLLQGNVVSYTCCNIRDVWVISYAIFSSQRKREINRKRDHITSKKEIESMTIKLTYTNIWLVQYSWYR